MKTPPSLRELKKLETRKALLAAGHKRFHHQGFDATTIEEICADVQISKRTYFRYFADKESLAFPHRQERLDRFQELLRQSPPGESPVATLRRIALRFASEYGWHRQQLLTQQRLIDATPALLAREREIDRDWELAMIAAFRARLGSGEATELRARVLAGAVIGVIRATMRYWFEHDAQPDLAELGQRALDGLEQGFFR